MNQHVHPQPLHTSMAMGLRRKIQNPPVIGTAGHRLQGQHGRVMPSTCADKLGSCLHGSQKVYGMGDTVTQECFCGPLWSGDKKPQECQRRCWAQMEEIQSKLQCRAYCHLCTACRVSHTCQANRMETISLPRQP